MQNNIGGLLLNLGRKLIGEIIIYTFIGVGLRFFKVGII